MRTVPAPVIVRSWNPSRSLAPPLDLRSNTSCCPRCVLPVRKICEIDSVPSIAVAFPPSYSYRYRTRCHTKYRRPAPCPAGCPPASAQSLPISACVSARPRKPCPPDPALPPSAFRLPHALRVRNCTWRTPREYVTHRRLRPLFEGLHQQQNGAGHRRRAAIQNNLRLPGAPLPLKFSWSDSSS